jgi:geranylgeranyl diphosphate synthase type II
LLDELCEPGILKVALSYSLMAGGKRLRPALCLMTAGMFGSEQDALDVACAIEMIHTYSLIHDDLPAMDNDDLRRGKPSNHIVFGEAHAILAGDGLLTSAFEVMLKAAIKDHGRGLDYLKAMQIISNAAGANGMVAGQAADMEFEGAQLDQDDLRYIHERKTAAMIKASVLAGAALKNASSEELAALETYSGCVGLAFQIIDDVLDETGNIDELGKTPGKDDDSGKLTFARLFGIEESRHIARIKTDEAKDALSVFGNRGSELKSLAEYLVGRNK